MSVFLVLVTISQVQKCFKLCDSKYIRFNYILYLYLYTCRLVQLSHFISKVSLCLRQWLLQNSELIKLQRTPKCQWSSQPQIGYLCHAPATQGSGNTMEEGEETLKEPEVREKKRATVSSGHHWHPLLRSFSADVLALHKIKTVNTPAWRVAGLMNLHPSAKAIES